MYSRPPRPDPSLEAAAQPLGDDLLRVLLADEETGPHHLRKRPIADSLAVGQAPPGVPEHVAGEAVDVLEEFPGKT